jgi:hypothetical protein
MASLNQIKMQIASEIKYVNGELVEPPLPDPGPGRPQLVISQGLQEEGADLGVVKVENGKLVLDMEDFSPDFGTF